MTAKTKMQAGALIVLGALLGYAAALGRPSQKADARPAEQSKAAPTAPGCCSDGLSRAGMLALASHNEAAADKAAKDGKKPNILVIFADDVGVWNISAYHHGMMGGRTPNIDRLAKE